jgi:hypothetical protein
MTTVTIEPGSLFEHYDKGELVAVSAHLLVDHPVHGEYLTGVLLKDALVVAWQNAPNDVARMMMLRAAAAQQTQDTIAKRDRRALKTATPLPDALFGGDLNLP